MKAGTARVAAPAPVATTRDALDPAWSGVASGIALVLFAAGGRILCALLGVLAVSGGSGASDYGSLRAVGDTVMGVGILTGFCGVLMLCGVFMMARAPRTADAMTPASTAFACVVLGMILDAATTKLMADAFGGSVGAAFLVMDIAPVLAGVGTLLGMGGGVALLRALGKIGVALSRNDLAERARSTEAALIVVGIGGSFVQLSTKFLPAPIVLVFAIIVLPAALWVAIRFVAVALAIRGEIGGRPSSPS